MSHFEKIAAGDGHDGTIGGAENRGFVDCETGCFAGFVFFEGSCFGAAGIGGDFGGVKVRGREDAFGFGGIAAHATFWVEGRERTWARAGKGAYDGCHCSTYKVKKRLNRG